MTEPIDISELSLQQRGVNLLRGTAAALIFGLLGFLAPALLLGVLATGHWIMEGTSEFALNQVSDVALGPMIGVGLVLACAGWATFAPSGNHRFASTLAIIFAISVIGWIVLGSMNLTPPRYKNTEHPFMYPSEAFVFFTPPILGALVLTLIRYLGPLPASPSESRSVS